MTQLRSVKAIDFEELCVCRKIEHPENSRGPAKAGPELKPPV